MSSRVAKSGPRNENDRTYALRQSSNQQDGSNEKTRLLALLLAGILAALIVNGAAQMPGQTGKDYSHQWTDD